MTYTEVSEAFREIVNRNRSVISQGIVSAFANPNLSQAALSPVKYHFEWEDQKGNPEKPGGFPGKGLRSTLLLESYKALGGDPEMVAPLAGAIEMIHNFTLIHDDIEDGDSKRRGRTTLQASAYGMPRALNAGDYLHVLAYQQILLLHQAPYCFSSEATLSALGYMLNTVRKVAEGQDMDIAFEQRTQIGVDEYLQMIAGKTGALIEASVVLSGILGGADDQTLQQLYNYAAPLGRLLQIRDDYEGIWGETEETGKTVGIDIVRRKKSYPVLYAIEQAQKAEDSQEKRILLDFYSSDYPPTEEKIYQVQKTLEHFGAREETLAIMGEQYNASTNALHNIDPRNFSQEGKDNLKAIADFFSPDEEVAMAFSTKV